MAARHIKKKPLMVLNYFNQEIIGSMRVPEDLDFDAGTFLSEFNEKIDFISFHRYLFLYNTMFLGLIVF